MNLRHGQWVKFAPVAELEKLAHKTASGHMLGIFQKGGTDALGATTVDHVSPVNPDGGQIIRLDGTQVVRAQLDPAGLSDLHALTDRADVPATRLATMDPNWTPKG